MSTAPNRPSPDDLPARPVRLEPGEVPGPTADELWDRLKDQPGSSREVFDEMLKQMVEAGQADRWVAADCPARYTKGPAPSPPEAAGMSRQEIWESLPEELRRNRKQFDKVLNAMIDTELVSDNRATKLGGPRFRRRRKA